MREHDFQKFYYRKVALGEGCGCAERVIDVHEFDRLSSKPRLRGLSNRPSLFRRICIAFRARKANSDATED
ncbi:hypothetical protein [uncultured Shimia sp.]|uniref:hypothetical protein n=1 Tax=uncultured Shimia sp. TaxID=573152 RepID=UPI002605D13C|nr:hypothetical protein [uncultured Shimia sp.]